MSIVVVDGKGRIVIPGDIRRKMRLRKGGQATCGRVRGWHRGS